MGKFWLTIILLSGFAGAQQKPVLVEHGVYNIHMLMHLVGKEEYRVTQSAGLQMQLQSSSVLFDRGNKRAGDTTLDFAFRTFEPEKLTEDTAPASPDGPQTVSIENGQATVQEAKLGRTMRKPPVRSWPSRQCRRTPRRLCRPRCR